MEQVGANSLIFNLFHSLSFFIIKKEGNPGNFPGFLGSLT